MRLDGKKNLSAHRETQRDFQMAHYESQKVLAKMDFLIQESSLFLHTSRMLGLSRHADNIRWMHSYQPRYQIPL